MTVLLLDGVPRDYAWGSTSALQRLAGLPVDGRPLAELWFGAHPHAPSPAREHESALDALLRRQPGLVAPHDGLPFLVKILAAERALSMQVHPDLAQARAGYAAENAAGLAPDAPERNYRDPNHKPELVCALTTFDALCGFAPVARTLDLLTALDAPELGFLADLLRGADPLRAAFTAVLRHEDPAALAAAVLAGADRLGGHGEAVALIARDFPGDVGIVLALLLNHVVLAPGEALYLGAGNVHCYLRGSAVEVMAASDNVLRCAVTPKHVDVDELLQVTDFRELDEPRWPRHGEAFDVPVDDFRLLALGRGAHRLDGPGPRVVVPVDAPTRVDGLTAAPGHAAFVGADQDTVCVESRGRVFVASPGAP